MLAGIPARNFWRHRPPVQSPDTELESTLDSNNSSPKDASEEIDLQQLNESLSALATIFPDVRPEVFREMLGNVSPESRLQLVTESLLKHKSKWVRGRWKVSDVDKEKRHSGLALASNDRFRTAQYKAAVKAAFYYEFRGLSHSTIKAVMAEHNYSYSETRPAILALVSTSWRYSLKNVFLRRKIPSAADLPLVGWKTSPDGSLEPKLILTDSPELNEELHASVIVPFRQQKTEEQLDQDRMLAKRLNEEESERAHALFDCECCFTPSTFEEITTCNSGGHYICFRCTRLTLTEAVYGQGWAKSVDFERASLKCVAINVDHNAECHGHISRSLVQRALATDVASKDIWQKFENRLANDSLAQMQVKLLRCPFCVYAVYQDSPSSDDAQQYRLKIILLAAVLIFGFYASILFAGLTTIPTIGISFILMMVVVERDRLSVAFDLGISNIEIGTHANHGRKFTCRNPSCLRASCLRCSAPWIDVHVCHQSSRQALRTYVESAVTEAIKRTCPKCNLAFVKSSGCNKLVCVCGYAMCYLCRKDIGTESYMHFCQHFRVNPGEACLECDRCDLYRTEDEDVVIKRAKEQAVREWKEQEDSTSGEKHAETVCWSVEEEANSVGNRAVSRRKVGWRQK